MDYYEGTMQRRINRRTIMGGLRFLNAIREPQVALNRLLWHGYNTPPSLAVKDTLHFVAKHL